MIVKTTVCVAGSLALSSCCKRLFVEPEPLPRANEGSGEMTMVAFGWRLVSTTVFMPHFAQLNWTLGWAPTSASLSTCSVPQWLQAACMCRN
jgi:hypothetical protein